MVPIIILIIMLSDILNMTIRGTPAFVARTRREEPIALLIKSPIPGIRPMSGSRPILILVPGMVREASSSWARACASFPRSFLFQASWFWDWAEGWCSQWERFFTMGILTALASICGFTSNWNASLTGWVSFWLNNHLDYRRNPFSGSF
jgi:hypothetical protein